MKIQFNIEYYTKWGEDIRLLYSLVMKDGSKQPQKEYRLATADGRMWKAELEIEKKDAVGMEYLYAMHRNDELVWTEWETAPHKMVFHEDFDCYLVNDSWRPIPDDLPLFSSAFTECMGAKEEGEANLKLYPITLQLRAVEPRLCKGEHLAICGSSPQLGEWRVAQRMRLVALQEWAINMDASLLYNEVEYKYVVVNDRNDIIRWEEGKNRSLRSPQLGMRWSFPCFPCVQTAVSA